MIRGAATPEAKAIAEAIKLCRKKLCATRRDLERTIAMVNRGLRHAS